jgi:type IV pilus assembly protein PilY1
LLPDSTRTIRAIYAGDLHGNMWKFDVSDPAPANWVVAFSGSPLFVVRDASNVTQPITAPAEIGRHPNGGYMIYFGTGQFFATGDNIVTGTTQVQSFYGLWDKTGAGAISPSTDRSALQAQTILAEVTPTGSNFLTRVTSNTTPNWSTKRGWYIDLNSPLTAGPEGERVVSLPVLRNNKIIFPTLVPSSVPCEFGGTSWLMEMDAVTGSRLTQPPLDINENGQIDSGDNYTGTIGGSPGPWVVSGIRSGEGIIDTPAVVEIPGEDEEIKIASGTSGGVETIRERGETGQARGSWRQLR